MSAEADEPETVWHYWDSGQRLGPVSADALKAMLEGPLPQSTLVWKMGMVDWLPASQTDLFPQVIDEDPPPLSEHAVGNGYAWAGALTPAFSTVFQALLISVLDPRPTYGGYVSGYSIGGYVANIIFAAADYRALAAAGWAPKIKQWWMFVPPVFIFKRDQALGAGMTRFWVWIGTLAASLLLLLIP